MTETDAPREDQLELPASWAKVLPPRRGLRAAGPVELDPGASEAVRGLIDWHEPEIRTAMDKPENADYAPAVRRHLDSLAGGGEPDPLGAGAIAALVGVSERRKSESSLRPEFDAWVADYGLPFAVAAAIVRYSVDPWAGAYNRRLRGQIAERRLTVTSLAQLGSVAAVFDGAVNPVRGLLASASETEYAAAVARVGAVRTDATRRFVTALVMPEQRAWTEEACREFDPQEEYYAEVLLWSALDDPAAVAAAGLGRINQWWITTDMVAAIVGNLGAHSLPILLDTLRQHPNGEARRLLLKAVALLPTDEAMAYLVANLAEPYVLPHLADAAKRFPARALRVIAAKAEVTAPELRPMLASLADRVPDQHRDALTDTERAAVEALTATIAAVPSAPAKSLPPLLTSPPWTAKRAKRKPVVIEGLTSPAETRVVWAEGERDRWSQAKYNYFGRYSDEDWHRRILSLGTPDADNLLAIALTYAPMPIATKALEKWRGAFALYQPSDLKVILSRFEARVADRVVAQLRSNSIHHETIVPIRGVEAARLAADWFARLKSARPSAIAWIDRHGADGAALLVPDALGADKKARRNAEGALTVAAMRHGADAIAAAAAPYGEAAVAAIGDLLDGDPLEPRGAKVPKIPDWATAYPLPPVLLKDREHALSRRSVPHLITVLALATPDYPYAGLDVVAETFDRASLARFSRALFQMWLAAGAPTKEGWALTQLAHFADDDTVRLLAPKVREWPGQSQHKRAVTGLGVLGAIGSEEALRAIQGIADKVKFKALKEEARIQIEAIATGLGLSREQLADRLVPDFGLGEDAALTLDYGPRAFTVVFDEQLKPYVTDATGKPRKSLPKPGAKDDPEVAAAAYKRFSLLKKELRTASADQVARLENAMAQGRTWNAEEFTRYFATHPLVKHLARRLVWTAESGGASIGFRIAEDGTLSDVDDDAVALPDDAVIRLAHPIRLGASEIAAWAEILADYEILQPFEQLSRPVMAFTEDELATGCLERFEGAKVEVGRVLGLTKRGWLRASPEDGGVEPGVYFPLPEGGFVTVALDPGIWVGMIGENPIQTFAGVRVADQRDFWYGGERDKETRPPAVDPQTASEILAALARITGRS
ncbi:DUF4132 domain-containing protein, partial [Glycomyces sp. NRRL B-16210]|uniref:DUF4132 domain-containing protein n=1 Tax=Glycomyces sp. NRRL B-16210 TaxID=1463821 RepID=UPI0004C2752D